MASDPAAKKDSCRKTFPGREFKRSGYSLFVDLAGDRMECRVSYAPNSQGAMMTRDELCAFLAQSDVKAGMDGEELERFAARAAAGETLCEVPIAAGIQPVNGADGCLELIARASLVAHHEDGEEEGDSHDFRNVQTFVNVGQGDEIGRIMPPERGVPGRRVTGEIVIPRHGRALKLRIGKNIRTEDDGGLLVAAAEGRVCHAHGEISVEQIYQVAGDVNFKVGSINFNGVVEVRGDVLDGFTITASKGLRVDGNIGACGIAADGDVTFRGMDGQGSGSIICGGSISAQFIHDCRIECAGDVVVEREIHNCTILTLGRIIVGKGIIAGGSYTALGGMEALRIGSRAAVFTKLTVGADYRDVMQLQRLHAELADNHERLAGAEDMKEVEALRFERSLLTDRIMELRTRIADVANPKLNVRSRLHENVLVTIGDWSQTFREEQSGPASIIENTLDGGLRFLAMTDLDVRAADLERAFVPESGWRQ